MNTFCSNSGQVVLVVLLTMIVGLTIALSIFLNTLSDTSITLTEEGSEEAFGIAEAGIEELLYNNNINEIIGTYGEDVEDRPAIRIGDFQADVVAAEETELEVFVSRNSVATVQLNAASYNIVVYWTKAESDEDIDGDCPIDENNPDALPAGIIVGTLKSDNTVTYAAYRPNGCSVPSDGAGWEDSNSGRDEGFRSMASVPTASNDIQLRIRPVFRDATIKVTGDELPRQQITITSSSTTESGESRAIEVVKTEPDLPDIFDYVLFSGGDLEK
ncbi:MAG: hypothetical protein ACOX6V_00400 [Patescibacteria group bacterium]|jgi:hypothetical protein